MRKTSIILSALSIFILIANFVEAADTSELDAKIRKVKSYLEKPGGPGSDGNIMFALLLDTIIQTAPETRFPPEFAEVMKKAKEATDPKSMFNPDGFVYLNKAYRLINASQAFQMPDSISGIQDIINYARIKLASAREHLKPGKLDIDACLKDLLYAALLIMTPRHQ